MDVHSLDIVYKGAAEMLLSSAEAEWDENGSVDLRGSGYSAHEFIDEPVMDELKAQINDFVASNFGALLAAFSTRPASSMPWEAWQEFAKQVGEDFILTRNHEGAGFWDRGDGGAGDYLTKNAHPYGSVSLMVGGTKHGDWTLQIVC